ncbi:benzoate para-hydroxylase [Flagelloscypha sp. PMI_526]|nr:benzoate para-hydroxylase [Flagelloscypha sp. PMI_526]
MDLITLFPTFSHDTSSIIFNILPISLLVGCLVAWLNSSRGAIPGPASARWSPLWLAYQVRKGRRYLEVHKLHQKYGPVVRLAPNNVSVASREAIAMVYGQGHKALDKSPYYSAFTGDKASIFSTVDREEHSRKRRIVSQAFSLHAIEDFSPVHQPAPRHRRSSLTIKGYVGEQQSDFVKVIHADGSVGYGNAIQLVDGREHLAAVLGVLPSSLRAIFSNALKLVDPFFKEGKDASEGLRDFAREKLLDRLASNVHRDDILGKILMTYAKSGKDVAGEALQELVAECVTLLIAGSDTTATTTSATIFYVLNNPHIYKKLMLELDEHLSDLSDGELPTIRQVKNLPVFARSMMVDGYFIPPGTEVSVPAFTAQRLFFEDGDTFDPERWLKGDATDMRKYLLTFGAGPRACLGRHLAETEIMLILSTILPRFEFSLKSNTLASEEGFVHKVMTLPVDVRLRTKA